MAKLLSILSIIFGLIIGTGIAILGTSLIPGVDQMVQIGLAIVLSVFAAISLYFLTKGAGGSS